MSRVALIGLVVSLPLAANAATFTQTVTLPTFDPYYGEVYDNNIPAFDTTLGTLTSLNVEVRVAFSETIPVETTSHQPFNFGSVSFITNSSTTVGGPSGLVTVDAPTVMQTGTISTVSAQSNTGTATVGGNFDYSINVDPFTAYYDPPEVRVNAGATIPTGSPIYQFEDAQSTFAGGTLTLTYTYTAVPEPMTLTLLATLVLGAVVPRLRARA